MQQSPNKSMQPAKGKCQLCGGSGRVPVVDRDKVSRGTATDRDKTTMPCPICSKSGFYRTK